MATTKIIVTNGIFTGRFATQDGTSFDTGAFRGTVDNDGTITVTRYKGDGGVEGTIKPSGYFVINNQGAIKKGRVKLDATGKLSCTLGLHTSTGPKYMWVRDLVFQRWLDARGITGVIHDDPNQRWLLFQNHSGWGDAEGFITTDGTAVIVDKRNLAGDDWPDSLWSYHEDWEVTGATWTIVNDFRDWRDQHGKSTILHTLVKDVTTLDIPVIDPASP